MDWVYSEKVKDHFRNPRNILEDEDKYKADGKGYVGNPKCGDLMFMAIKVNEAKGIITECKWKTYGCASAVASTSVLSEMVTGMSLEKAYNITPKDILEELGGLPGHKVHCSVLGDKALRAAIDDYKKGKREKVKAKESSGEKETDKIICHCLNVSQGEIEKAVKDGVKTFEELQEKTKISTGCGSCEKEARSIFKEYLHKKG